MKRFYLTGHRTFGNRGCEAIVRSTVMTLKHQFGDIEVLVPSDDVDRDARQWPDAPQFGVHFVGAYVPRHQRYWAHLQRLPLPALKRAGWPFPFPNWLKAQLASVDAVLSVGGDNYSLDYRLPSLLMGLDSFAMDMGKPVILWGASVGPFEREPHFVPAIREHLARFSAIFVRESVSFQYLTQGYKLHNVTQMADPAFTLQPAKFGTDGFWPRDRGRGTVGLNISPLIERYKHSGQDLIGEAATFVRSLANDQGYGVLLVPHVMPLNGSGKNNDAHYMNEVLKRCRDLGDAVTMAPDTLNAAQLKYVISQLRFFIGARTHATIAALSSGVPTISIAYSIKAQGINRDLFGNEHHILSTPKVCKETLLTKLRFLQDQENEIRTRLAEAMPEYKRTVHHSALSIKGMV